jgi:hypothetical protein
MCVVDKYFLFNNYNLETCLMCFKEFKAINFYVYCKQTILFNESDNEFEDQSENCLKLLFGELFGKYFVAHSVKRYEKHNVNGR